MKNFIAVQFIELSETTATTLNPSTSRSVISFLRNSCSVLLKGANLM